MKFFSTLVFIFFFLPGVFSQVNVTGTVENSKGKPIPNAGITLKNTYDGASADSSGNYNFITTEKGQFEMEATALGYKPVTKTITIDSLNIAVNFILKEEVNELTAVMVMAGSFEAGDKKRAATVLSSIDVVTTAGSNGDISQAVKNVAGCTTGWRIRGFVCKGRYGIRNQTIH